MAASPAVYPVLRALEEPGGSGAATSSMGSAPPSSRCAGALDRLRAVREPADRRRTAVGPPARRRRPGEPVRRGAAVAAPGRGRPAAAPARGRSLRRPRRRGRGAVPRARRLDAPDARPRRRSGRRRCSRSAASARSSATGGSRELVIRKVDGLPVAESPFRDQLLACRASAPATAAWSCAARRATAGDRSDARRRHALPHRRRSAAVPRRTGRAGGARPGSGRRARRSNGSSASAIDAVESQGKNLLIRFDGGLRAPDPPPHERLVAPLPTRRALASAAGPRAARARGRRCGRGLLRCPGRRAVRDAERAHSIRRSRVLGPGPPRRRLRCGRGPPPAARARRGPTLAIGVGAARPAGAGRHRQRLQERGRCGSSASRRSPPVATLDDATLERLVATAPPPDARERRRAARTGARDDGR